MLGEKEKNRSENKKKRPFQLSPSILTGMLSNWDNWKLAPNCKMHGRKGPSSIEGQALVE